MHVAVPTTIFSRPARVAACARAALGAAVLVAVTLGGCTSSGHSTPSQPSSRDRTLVTSIRSEPRSFNRYLARDLSTEVVTQLMQASLVRVNRVTQQLEPRLAERWELLPDQVTYRLHLRPGILFSDGQPFSSADVVFSFRAIYDPGVASVLADTLTVGGKPLVVTAVDTDTVQIRFPAPFGPGLRMLDGVPILPRHLLDAALVAGTFATTWTVASSPTVLAGLGPFVLQQHQPGERLVFARNPHYWEWDGPRQLPALDQLVLEIVPDQDAERLQLEAGTIDATQGEMRPSDYGGLKRAAAQGKVALHDLGVGPDGDWLWFNLAPSHGDRHRRWLQDTEFRRAVSQAVDRQPFVDSVYLGAAVPAHGIVSPGNSTWFEPVSAPEFNLADAQRRLAALGLVDRNADGVREDGEGRPAHFVLLTQAGNTSLERGAAAVRESLRGVGVQVDVVALEVNALIQQVMSGDYDAAYFRLLTTDSDPALNLDLWLSGGSAHIWHPEQSTPGTAWERDIDRLMQEMAAATDQPSRRARFGEVQRILAREVPALCFAFPRVTVAMSTRISYSLVAVSRPPLLWNPAVIRLSPASRAD